MTSAKRDRLGRIVPPPLWYALGLVVGWLISLRVGVVEAPPLMRWAAGIVCVVVGLAFVVSAVAEFARTKTSVMPIRPTTTLVTSGPYRLTRNPIYVGFAFVYVGVALITNWLWAIAVLPIVLEIVHVAAILPEERFLEARFGPTTYADYRSRVRRWL